MNDAGRAMVTALMPTAFFVMSVWMPVREIMRAHMQYFRNGPLNFMHPGMSTMMGFLILVIGVFLVFFIPSVVLWKTVSMRRAGLVLKRAHGEVQRGMPGMEGLRERVR